MASNTIKSPELSISDLADILAALTEVVRPYQLGIQLKIDLAKPDIIERNHPGDIDRQKAEVVKYWLPNSPDASWTTLANAVERMGGHAKLVKTLREKEQSNMGDTAQLKGEEQIHEKPVVLARPLFSRQASSVTPVSSTFKRSTSATVSLDVCVPRNILLLGKMGHGTSTLGNRILNSDGWFKINDQQYPQTSQGSSMIKSESQLKNYKIEVYDHSGLFEGASSIEELFSAVPDKLNLVIFILKRGYDFDESEVEILKSVMNKWQISGISALVLTHCECLSEEERGEMIEQLKKDHPSIAEMMGKGILAVGFPDSSHIQPGSPLSQRVEEDKANLRQLIYSCESGFRRAYQAAVLIPESLQNEQVEHLRTSVRGRQPPQKERIKRLQTSIRSRHRSK